MLRISFYGAPMKTIVLSLIGLNFGVSLLAASPLQEARINRIINDVSVLDPAKGAHKAMLQEVIKDEIGVKTGIKSRSELLFQDETLTRLGPDSYFSFKPGTREMDLQKGTMLLQVPKGLGGAKIRTAAVTASITGTTIMLENIPGRDLKVLVLEGSLRLSVNGTFGDSLLLLPGKMVIMPPNAKRIPDPVSVDLAKVMKTSSLITMGGNEKPLPSLSLIQQEIAVQTKAKIDRSLVETNLVILGGGTKVVVAPDTLLAALKAGDELNGIVPPTDPGSSIDPTGNAGGSNSGSSGGTSGGGTTPGSTGGGSSTAIALVDPNNAQMSGNFTRVSAGDLTWSDDIAAKKVEFVTGRDLSVTGALLAEDLDFDAGRDAFFRGFVRAKKIEGTAVGSITFLGPIGARQIKLRAPLVTATSMNATERLEITGKFRAGGDAVISSSKITISEGIDASGRQGTATEDAGAGYHLTLLSDDEIKLDDKPNSINGINADGGAALAGTSLTGGDGGVIDIGTQTNAIGKNVTLDKAISATSGANSLSNLTGGNGGTVNVVANGTIKAHSTIKVSDSAASHASRSGGNIALDSHRSNGTAIDVSSSAQLLALLSASAPGPGGSIKFTSAGGTIKMSGNAQADRGTIDIRNNGGSGIVNLTGATLNADAVKVGALGNDGTLNVGGGTISADSTIKLYAGGSNGAVNFTDNVTLSGNSVKTIAGNTVTIFNGKIVTVNGPAPVSVFTNHANYTGFGGNGSTTGTFGGQGAVTQALSAGPPGY